MLKCILLESSPLLLKKGVCTSMYDILYMQRGKCRHNDHTPIVNVYMNQEQTRRFTFATLEGGVWYHYQ